MQTDNVTKALEQLRSETDQGCWTSSDWDEHAADTKIARDYALASTEGRPLTREWLEAALGPADVPCVLGDSREAWFRTGTTWIEYKGGWALAMKGNHPHTLSITADAIAFFQLTRWPVSRAKIVEAWRASG